MMRIQQRLARDLPCNTERRGDHCRSSLSQPRPDAVSKFQMSSLNRSQRRRFMLAMPSSCSVSNTSSRIWCRIGEYMVNDEDEHYEKLAIENLNEMMREDQISHLQDDDDDGDDASMEIWLIRGSSYFSAKQ
ncbi:hypothetical protein Tco_0139915 [Tanacetum coccineum]